MVRKTRSGDDLTPDLFAADARPEGIRFDGEAITLADFAERAYLDYAVSVVKFGVIELENSASLWAARLRSIASCVASRTSTKVAA